jgi:predicted glutamine amidotransferase
MKDLKNKYQEQFSQEFYGRNLFRTQEEEFLDAPKEECGIFGLYSDNEVDTFSLSQFGLFALQHRGQEACGVSVASKNKIITVKDEGLVLDVFKTIPNPETLLGNAVIGHTRYTTAGDKKKYNFQPFFAKNEYDQPILSIAHNGNLTNAKELKAELEAEGVVFKATSDSEVILRLIQKNLDLGLRAAIHRLQGGKNFQILLLVEHLGTKFVRHQRHGSALYHAGTDDSFFEVTVVGKSSFSHHIHFQKICPPDRWRLVYNIFGCSDGRNIRRCCPVPAVSRLPSIFSIRDGPGRCLPWDAR